MATWQRVNGRSVIVADDKLMLVLAEMLEKMVLVEAKLIQLRLQGSLPSATGADASGATSRVESAQSTARMFAMKAVEVAKEAVLFCARLDNTCGRLETPAGAGALTTSANSPFAFRRPQILAAIRAGTGSTA